MTVPMAITAIDKIHRTRLILSAILAKIQPDCNFDPIRRVPQRLHWRLTGTTPRMGSSAGWAGLQLAGTIGNEKTQTRFDRAAGNDWDWCAMDRHRRQLFASNEPAIRYPMRF
jgi:hypothetical protein